MQMSNNVINTMMISQESSFVKVDDEFNFEVSDFLEFDDWVGDINYTTSVIPGHTRNHNDEMVINFSRSGYNEAANATTEGSINGGERVAFRTKSQVEVLDDGFKWRKYGKKKVKNSPNPRNYYKCSVEGCLVKKRVERDKEDTGYVITTYEGTHTHPSSTQI